MASGRPVDVSTVDVSIVILGTGSMAGEKKTCSSWPNGAFYWEGINDK